VELVCRKGSVENCTLALKLIDAEFRVKTEAPAAVRDWNELMPPATSRDFQRAAGQRLIAARTLLAQNLTLDAQYLGGYTVECSLKALILHRTPEAEKAGKLRLISSGANMHRPERLLGELRNVGVVLPAAIARRMRRFDWATDLRYETGRKPTGETVGFLKTVDAIYEWVEGQLP
jgi:hypothetical protein